MRNKANRAGGAVCSVPARAYKETPCGVTTNGIDSAKQSQRPCRTDGGLSPAYRSEADPAKQSQVPAEGPAVLAAVETQHFASPSPEPDTHPPTTDPRPSGPAPAPCETKPTGRACEGFRDGAAACSLRVALSQPWAPAMRVRRRLAATSRGTPSVVREMVDAVRKVVYPCRDGPV